MKKISMILTGFAALFVGGLSAMHVSDIFITNKTDKTLVVGPRTMEFYSWNGRHTKTEQIGDKTWVNAGDTKKIASVRRDLTILSSTSGIRRLVFELDGQKQIFESTKNVGLATTLTYNNDAFGIKQMRLPVKVDGLEITSKPVFGKLYHDVYMTVSE